MVNVSKPIVIDQDYRLHGTGTNKEVISITRIRFNWPPKLALMTFCCMCLPAISSEAE